MDPPISVRGRMPGTNQGPVSPVLIPPSHPQVTRLGLSEARSLLLFTVALAGAAALGCTRLVACADHLIPIWRHPGTAFAP